MSLFNKTVVAMVIGLVTSPAFAHIDLLEPVSRYGASDQKFAPCGRPDGERSNKVTYARSGATITVTFEETIDHPGHYRIAFDADGHDDFVDPAGFNDFYTNDAVLLDDIDDNVGGNYEVTVQLPNITCDTCTLQLIQVMTDKGPEYGDNDLYYACADMNLAPDGPEIPELVEAEATDGSSAATSDGDSSSGPASTPGDSSLGDSPGAGEGTASPGSAGGCHGGHAAPTASLLAFALAMLGRFAAARRRAMSSAGPRYGARSKRVFRRVSRL